MSKSKIKDLHVDRDSSGKHISGSTTPMKVNIRRSALTTVKEKEENKGKYVIKDGMLRKSGGSGFSKSRTPSSSPGIRFSSSPPPQDEGI